MPNIDTHNIQISQDNKGIFVTHSAFAGQYAEYM